MKVIKKLLNKFSDKYNNIRPIVIERATIGFIVFGAFICSFIAIFIISDIILQPDIEALEIYKPTIPTKIYDINGDVISEFFNEQRELVEYNNIPPDLINAVISMEDQNFLNHSGIDIMGIMRATFGNFILGRRMRGASTITQQVARGIVLKSSERTIIRKFKEIWLSFQIERRYTKEEIITFYFNQIYFGHSVYGVQAASRFYFNKNVNELNLSESAILATLPPSPNSYSPINNPNNSILRHKVVFDRMIVRGFITKQEADESFKEFWSTFSGKIGRRGSSAYTSSIDRAPYVTEYIRRILIDKYGEKMLKEDGLKIYTTIDLKKQNAGQETLSQALIEQNEFYNKHSSKNVDYVQSRYILDRIDMLSTIFSLEYDIGENKYDSMVIKEINKKVSMPLALFSDVFGLKEVNDVAEEAMQREETDLSKQIEGALVSIDPRNGYIVTMVGGSGFTPRNQLNRVTQAKRQPGSVFKPFVYAYALESKKFNLATVIDDAPIGYVVSDGKYWVPRNYSGTYQGAVTFRRALVSSINVVTVKILDALGIDESIEYIAPIFNAYDENTINRMFNKDLTMALGTGLFTPLEITQGFAVFANNGVEVEPILIRYVTDRYGVVIDDFEQEQKKRIALKGGSKQVVSKEVSYMMSELLSGVLRGGTATTAMYNAKFTKIAAGKTGTTSDWKDAWFVGYTPQLVTGVWLGFDSFAYSLGRNRASAKTAAPIWGNYMREALKDERQLWYKQPPTLIRAQVCSVSGLVVTPDCLTTISDIFLPGTVPYENCDICAQQLEDLGALEDMLEIFGNYENKENSNDDKGLTLDLNIEQN